MNQNLRKDVAAIIQCIPDVHPETAREAAEAVIKAVADYQRSWAASLGPPCTYAPAQPRPDIEPLRRGARMAANLISPPPARLASSLPGPGE